MDLFQIDREHFLVMGDLRRKMNMSTRVFENNVERYGFVGKGLNISSYGDTKVISCKSVVHFLTWYLEGTYMKDEELVQFRQALTKYAKKNPKRAVSRALQREIAFRQEYKCAICGLFPIPANYEIDHVVELQDGGQDVASNLAALCVPCHSAKTHRNRLQRLSQCREQRTPSPPSLSPASLSPPPLDPTPAAAPEKSVFSKYFRPKAKE
jgi:hypothetical protein